MEFYQLFKRETRRDSDALHYLRTVPARWSSPAVAAPEL
jgi:hypothetical protein